MKDSLVFNATAFFKSVSRPKNITIIWHSSQIIKDFSEVAHVYSVQNLFLLTPAWHWGGRQRQERWRLWQLPLLAQLGPRGCRRRRSRRRLWSGHGQRRSSERARQLPQDGQLRPEGHRRGRHRWRLRQLPGDFQQRSGLLSTMRLYHM